MGVSQTVIKIVFWEV